MNKQIGPYFKTTLEADVPLWPYQMQNNAKDHLKTNLKKNYIGKTFENYGYISEIYTIDENFKGGKIRAEDTSSSSVYRLKFTCKICNPLVGSYVIGTITGISSKIISAMNGPIFILIDEVNDQNIVFTKNAFYQKKPNGEIINKIIDKGTHIIVRIKSKKIDRKAEKIIALAMLENVVDDEIGKENAKNIYASTNNDMSVIASSLVKNKIEYENENENTEFINENNDNEDNDNDY
jgi:DNA-directed RNA polymerase subunit E'/Rpb7